MRKFKGKLFIISGPSRVGKDAIVKRLLGYQNLKLSTIITYTTRPKRMGEKDGREHIFVTPQFFKKMIINKEFLEWKWFANHRYGTPKEKVIKKLTAGKNILLNIEVQGAQKVKKQLPDTITIFITADSKKEVKRRIFNSDELSWQQKNLRWQRALEELKLKNHYNYIVINKWGKLNQTVKLVKKIIAQNIKQPLTK